MVESSPTISATVPIEYPSTEISHQEAAKKAGISDISSMSEVHILRCDSLAMTVKEMMDTVPNGLAR